MKRNTLRVGRRNLLLGLGLAVCLPFSAVAAFPEKPITIVVPTSAGGGNDAMARLIGQRLSQAVGQPVVVDNRAGANGSIASEYVAKAAPDGYTLIFGYIATHSMNPALQQLRYDPIADFEPVALVGFSPTLMVANKDAAVKDVRDLIAQLKAKPDRYAYASAGNGTAPHFAAELFKLKSGVTMIGVPYKGSGPALNDTISGHTQIMFPSLFTSYPHVKAGKLKALALAGAKRSPQLPDVPTLKEVGIDGVEVTQWYGFLAPARTPKPVVESLNKALNKVLSDPEVIKRIEGFGADVEAGNPEQFKSLLVSELAKWKRVVADARLVAD